MSKSKSIENMADDNVVIASNRRSNTFLLTSFIFLSMSLFLFVFWFYAPDKDIVFRLLGNSILITMAFAVLFLLIARDRYNDLTHEIGFTSGVIRGVLEVVGFKDIVILDERPQPYKLVNLVRWVLFVAFTGLANLVLLAIGISPPRVWTTSMWVSARK